MLSFTFSSDNKKKKEKVKKAFMKYQSYTKIVIFFKMLDYKLVTNVQAFNGETLLGNLGGYIGLFLGFAIWQTPEILTACLRKMNLFVNACTSNDMEKKNYRIYIE